MSKGLERLSGCQFFTECWVEHFGCPIYDKEGEEILALVVDSENCAVFAAAPDLYEALAYAVAEYGKPGGPWNVPGEPGLWLEVARAALAKANGEVTA